MFPLLLSLLLADYYTTKEEDGEYWIMKKEECPTGSITIPERDDTGHTITGIYKEGFSQCAGITSVTVPSTITSIGDNAFSQCSMLTSFTYYGNSDTNTRSYTNK